MEAGILVPVQANTDVSAARRATLRAAEAAGFGEELCGAAAIVATEAASNLVKHAGGGEFIVRRTGPDTKRGIELLALDRGPGFNNVAHCFEDGYSTAGSAGTGLGAIARLSRSYDVYTRPNAGTVLVARFGQEPGTGIDVGAISIPYPGEENCGDAWEVHSSPDRFRVMVADGLGHGLFAFEASHTALTAATDPRALSPRDVLETAHTRLRSTRGSAASIADLDFAHGVIDYAGIGNVAGAIILEGGTRRQMVSLNGTLGHVSPKVQQFRYPLPATATLILHSDGLSSNWSLEKYPGLSLQHPSLIAGVLFRDFRRLRDDATVVVIRQKDSAS